MTLALAPTPTERMKSFSAGKARQRTVFVAKRIALVPLQLFAIIVAVFVLIRLLPANPAALKVGALATPQAIAQARTQLGLSKSIVSQLGSFLAGLAHGDLGLSWNTSQPVTS